MSHTEPDSVVVAAVQAGPAFLDRDRSVEKACRWIREAGEGGARIVVLPEVFIPGGPYWAWAFGMRQSMPFNVELFRNSVEVPGSETAALGEAARAAGAYVVIGVNERENRTIYNTLLYFDDQGTLLGKHRKFKPTGAEKLVWGEGDGSTHRVYPTPYGKLGGLICGEHTMQLPGYTLGAMGEQIHAAVWVGFSVSDTSLTEVCSRYYAIANNAHVIVSQSVVTPEIVERVGAPGMRLGNAWSAVVEMGTGKVLAGPLDPAEEGIVYATLDLRGAPAHYFIHEPTGHYRPKEFTVHFDPRPNRPVEFAAGAPRTGAPTPCGGGLGTGQRPAEE